MKTANGMHAVRVPLKQHNSRQAECSTSTKTFVFPILW